ncbi:uncharacterized protein LOC119364744 isoform X2 [Triticum dicoccoides]|uniref:uncharacterized protein LOC119364744 isoform X2 n=1 Tax=Triticum dicoccoides TaxID=85692 RepID=UPI00188F9D9D|nr:uncharacterized protein LOC119364744 isoform X2 [Triticum dicoccoides]
MQWWARCALKPPTAGHAEHGEKQDIGRCSCSLRHLIGRTKVSANIGMAEPHIDVWIFSGCLPRSQTNKKEVLLPLQHHCSTKFFEASIHDNWAYRFMLRYKETKYIFFLIIRNQLYLIHVKMIMHLSCWNFFVKQVSASIWNLGWQCHTLISRLSLPLPCFLKPLVVSFSSSVAHSERSYWAMDKIYSR